MASTGSVKAKIQDLINKTNAVTLKEDTDLTSAVAELIAGYYKGIEPNIAYGDTAPEDTSKLWVKTSEPSGVIVSKQLSYVEGDKLVNTKIEGNKLASYTWGCAYGNYIYSFGGDSYSKKVMKYDIEKDVVTTLGCSLSYGMNNVQGIACGDYIYVCQGQYGSTSYDYIYKFDPNKESVELLTAKLSVGRYNAPMVVHNGKIYIFGTAENNYDVDCLDPATDTCTSLKTTHSTALSGAYSYGDYIYLIGYATSGSAPIIRFNPAALTYETVNNIDCNYSLIRNGALYIGDNLIFMRRSYFHIAVYNLKTNELETITAGFTGVVNAEARHGIQIGNKLYLQAEYARYTVLCYEQLVSLASGKLQLVPSDDINLFRFVNTTKYNVELGVVAAYKGNENGKGESVEIALYKDGAWTTV